MPRNRSHSKPGHRAARSPKARGGSRAQNTLAKQGKVSPTNLIGAAMNAASSAIIDLTFDLPVQAGDPNSPGSTDINLTSSNGGATRHGISTSSNRPNFVSVTCSAALTRNKTYTAALLDNQGLIVPANGIWGVKSKTFNMPA